MTQNFIVIGLDFDGTCVKHEFPRVGETVPGCLLVLEKIKDAGMKIVLNTMRSGEHLQDALLWFEKWGIELYGINKNPTQHLWTSSPKVYANIYIDDAALGCPLKQDTPLERPYVDWPAVDKILFGEPVTIEKIHQ